MDENVYGAIDKTPLPGYLFYPRHDYRPGPDNAEDMMVAVEGDIAVHVRFYSCGQVISPWILYFHGNGEVVSDYDGIAPLYNRLGVNLAVADYRGYGKSSGKPGFSSMIDDARLVLDAVYDKIIKAGNEGMLWVMGRSMGSLPAVDLACRKQDKLKGIIVESGFLNPVRLLKNLGIPSFGINTKRIEEDSINKAKGVKMPVLIMHGEKDTLVPLSEAEDLYRYLGSAQKNKIIIANAEHNDIMFIGQSEYFLAIEEFLRSF